jgi:hypothetical protein
VGLGFSKCTGGSVDFFFGGPSGLRRSSSAADDARLWPRMSVA